MSDAQKLAVGDKAPNFEILDQDGKAVTLESFRGQKVVVYFYPAASTPGCTKEACDFNDNLNPFKAAGYTVLGISPDEIKKLKNFQVTHDLNFPLLSDPTLEAHKAYGAFGTKNLYGRVYEGVLRSTFTVDEDGIIQVALYNVKATGHVTMLRRLLGI